MPTTQFDPTTITGFAKVEGTIVDGFCIDCHHTAICCSCGNCGEICEQCDEPIEICIRMKMASQAAKMS